MRSILLSVFSLLLTLAPAFGVTSVAYKIGGATNVSIPNSYHNFNSANIGVAVFDLNGARIPDSTYSKSINTSTYQVDLTFSSATSGAVKLYGAFGSADVTNASKDFDAAFPNATSVYVCSTCTPSNWALAGGGTRKYWNATSLGYFAASGVGSVVYVYLDGGRLVFQVGTSAEAGTVSNSLAQVRIQSGGFPSGVEQLHKITFSGDGVTAPVRVEHRAWM